MTPITRCSSEIRISIAILIPIFKKDTQKKKKEIPKEKKKNIFDLRSAICDPMIVIQLKDKISTI